MKQWLTASMGAVFTFALSFNLHAQTSGYTVTKRGADYAVHQKTILENGTNRVHTYTELASGLNYKNAKGQWMESKEEIEPFANGAIARQGQYQVIFANNLNTAG